MIHPNSLIALKKQMLDHFLNGRPDENRWQYQLRIKHKERCKKCKKIFDTKVFLNCPRCKDH